MKKYKDATMTKKVFLDGNIFIDFYDKQRSTSQECFSIFNHLIKNDFEIYNSCDLITTIYYILSKSNKHKALYNMERVNKMCKIIEFSNKELSQTIQMMKDNEKFKDLEDAIQYSLAKNSNCSMIISNDKKFYSPDIEIFNSEEFIKKYIN